MGNNNPAKRALAIALQPNDHWLGPLIKELQKAARLHESIAVGTLVGSGFSLDVLRLRVGAGLAARA